MPVCEYAWLGRVEYEAAWDLQRRIAAERAAGERPDTLLLLEHPPVFTTGRRRNVAANLKGPENTLGAPLIETDRGGDITFHGPGQLIAYPVIDLRAVRLGVVDYVRSLEEVVMRILREYGIDSRLECGLTGVWVGNDKIAAIGVRVSRLGGAAGAWVTTHGVALNVSPDLAWFGRIVPCGISDRGVTSIEQLTGKAPPLPEVAESLAASFGEVAGREMRRAESLGLSVGSSALSA
jgi:lipoyl(octanoyl) transferase